MEEIKKRMTFEDRVKKDEKYYQIKGLFHESKFNPCIRAATQFLEKYGNSIQVLFMRAVCYRKIEEYNKEIDDLYAVLELDPFNVNALCELCFLYYYLNEFEKAKSILNILFDTTVIPADLIDTELLLKFKNELELLKLGKNITKEDIVRHISEKHIPDENNVEQAEDISYFYDSIDINYLYDTVKEALLDSKKANINSSYEQYYFGVPNVGRNDDEIFNFIRVIVRPGTDDIITIYPTNKIDYKNYSFLEVDYNKLHQISEKSYRA